MDKDRIFRNVRTHALRGLIPRHVLDISLDQLPVDPGALAVARARVALAASCGEDMAGRIEGQFHELSSVEDSGKSGSFRRLLGIACIAIDISEQERHSTQDESHHYLVASHRAVEECWVGASHELSNCLACLNHLVITKLERTAALGAWVGLSLAPDREDLHLRWVLSTRRFDTAIGSEILKCADDLRLGSRRKPATAEPDPITPDQAGARVADYIAARQGTGPQPSIRTVVRWEEISWAKPNVYGFDGEFWERQWIVYLDPPGDGLRSSLIAAVDRITGDVGYFGTANDEG